MNMKRKERHTDIDASDHEAPSTQRDGGKINLEDNIEQTDKTIKIRIKMRTVLKVQTTRKKEVMMEINIKIGVKMNIKTNLNT